jgi:hypothetical protein
MTEATVLQARKSQPSDHFKHLSTIWRKVTLSKMTTDCPENCRKCVTLVLISDLNIKKMCERCQKITADSKKNEGKIISRIHFITTVTIFKQSSDL